MRHFWWLMMVVGCCLAVAGTNGRAWAAAGDSQAEPGKPAATNPAAESGSSENAEKPAESEGEKSGEPTPEVQEAEKAEKGAGSSETEKPGESAAAAEGAAAAKPEQPKVHTVARAPLRIEVTLEGIFEARRSEQIALDPEQWTTFKVLKAVGHGARVESGDVLVSFDPEKIDQAIDDLRRELELAEQDIKVAEEQLAVLEETTPMDLEAADRARRIAREDLDYYLRVGRPLLLKSEEFSLKSARRYLENQEEELHQLEKMYQADDLTEETEKIVLRRAQFAVERARFSYEQAKEGYDQAMQYLIPRRDVNIKDQAARAELAWRQSQASLPANLRKQRVALEQLKETFQRSQKKLENLLADRELMTIHSPIDGVVYYGQCQRGKFSDSTTLAADLRPGGTVTAHEVIMTVVRSRPMFVRVTVPESKLHLVRAGIGGVVEPTGYPDLKLRGRVEQVAPIPFKSGSFDGQVTVKLGEEAEALMPGMACRVKLVAYENKRALVVPTTAVASDPDNPRKQYVYVLDNRDKPKRRLVSVGRRSGSQVEILDGLVEGDRILQQHPKETP